MPSRTPLHNAVRTATWLLNAIVVAGLLAILIALVEMAGLVSQAMGQLPCEIPCSEVALPLVIEHVDEICVIQTPDSDHCRVVFFRGNSVLATRLAVDEMTWGASNGRFRLIWQDYWTAERVVEADRFSVWNLDEDPTQQGQNGPWWCMFKNMRDLKQP